MTIESYDQLAIFAAVGLVIAGVVLLGRQV